MSYIRAGVVLLALPEAHLDLVTGSLNVYSLYGRFHIWHGFRLPGSLWSLLAFGLGLTFLLIYIYIIWNLNLKTNLNLKIVSKNHTKYKRHIGLKINPPRWILLKIEPVHLKIDSLRLKVNRGYWSKNSCDPSKNQSSYIVPVRRRSNRFSLITI